MIVAYLSDYKLSIHSAKPIIVVYIHLIFRIIFSIFFYLVSTYYGIEQGALLCPYLNRV